MMQKIAPADYIFTLETMNPTTGLYKIDGISCDENIVMSVLRISNSTKEVHRIQIFTLGLLEGPIQIITSIDEFMEFQK